MKIAVIGLGISGMGAAYILKQNGHQVTAYEKNDYIGGHSRTIEVELDGKKVPVDTGFIVFNYRNYPNLNGLFKLLNVPVEKSDMSFSASINGEKFEYGTKNLAHIFAQKSNLLNLKFWRLLIDILKFNRKAKAYLNKNPNITLGQCLDELKMGEWYKKYFLLAIGGAIWSTPVKNMGQFPAHSFIKFFDEHGLLTVNDQPVWHTVTGGSREYVKRLTAGFIDDIRLNCAVTAVKRENGKVIVTDKHGISELFDEVIFGCHSDQAFNMINDASDLEKEILGNFRYQKNHIFVHSDASFMPKRKACWASWVYKIDGTQDKAEHIGLSYWMNNLQNIKSATPVIVTLNATRRPKSNTIHNEYVFEHPVFDNAAIKSQQRLKEIQGVNKLWFAGAYQRYGFHEDGLASAVAVTKAMGAKIPWENS